MQERLELVPTVLISKRRWDFSLTPMLSLPCQARRERSSRHTLKGVTSGLHTYYAPNCAVEAHPLHTKPSALNEAARQSPNICKVNAASKSTHFQFSRQPGCDKPSRVSQLRAVRGTQQCRMSSSLLLYPCPDCTNRMLPDERKAECFAWYAMYQKPSVNQQVETLSQRHSQMPPWLPAHCFRCKHIQLHQCVTNSLTPTGLTQLPPWLPAHHYKDINVLQTDRTHANRSIRQHPALHERNL